MSQFTYLRGLVTRFEIARVNLRNAVANGSYQQCEDALLAWIAAYTDYINW